MKNFARLIVLALIVATLAACGSPQYDANGNQIGGGGMTAGQGALLGGMAGWLLGRGGRPTAYAAPSTVIQKNYYHPSYTPARPSYTPSYRPSYTPRPGFASTPSVRSSGSFGSGMRSSGSFGGGMRSGRR